jgi:cytochrome P450
MNALAPDPRDYDPFAKEVMADPLPYYRALRAQAPALFLPRYDTWVFSRFQDIMDVLAVGDNAFIATDTTLPNPERLLRHNEGKVEEFGLDPLPIGAMLGSPHYEVLRQAHMKPFRPKQVAAVEALVRKLADERLDLLLPQGTFDLTQAYGGLVSAGMICHLLDMPLSLAPEVLDLVNQLSLTDPEQGGNDVAVTIGRSVEMMRPHIARRRAAGADGEVPAIDGLIQLDYYGRPLTDDEIAVQLTCIFIGGVETVPKIAAHGLMELASRPDQLAAVRADLAKNVPVAVEEMIRYCAPAQWFARTAHKDVQVAGADIKVGQRVMVLFASAARDEAEYADPDAFLWNRPIKRLLAFGYGQHFCIGVHLARLEIRVLAETFLRRVPAFSFNMEGAVRLPSSFQWGWNSLPVVIG